jgi:hypothetical protein
MTAEDRQPSPSLVTASSALPVIVRSRRVCLSAVFTFAGIVHGQKTRAFFQKSSAAARIRVPLPTIADGPITSITTGYQAIGEPNSAHRRPVAGRVSTVMFLDGVLTQPELRLVTRREGIHFTT